MPVLLFPLLLAAILFLTPLSFLTVPAAPQPAPTAASTPAVQMHYTKGGIVQINTSTGATRFTPYRLAPQLDRRGIIRA
jgi:hypothetical protein